MPKLIARRCLVFASLLAFASSLALAPSAALAEEEADAGASTVTMLRLYNPNSGEHFYTASSCEWGTLVRLGWKDEGVGWTAPAKGSKGSYAVYRLYNPNAGDHHYTANAKERDNLKRVGWRYEGIGWYSAAKKGGVPLYRQYNPNARAGAHNYTTSKAESDKLVRVGWRYEGIGWYGISAPAPSYFQGSFAYANSYDDPYNPQSFSIRITGSSVFASVRGREVAGNVRSVSDLNASTQLITVGNLSFSGATASSAPRGATLRLLVPRGARGGSAKGTWAASLRGTIDGFSTGSPAAAVFSRRVVIGPNGSGTSDYASVDASEVKGTASMGADAVNWADPTNRAYNLESSLAWSTTRSRIGAKFDSAPASIVSQGSGSYRVYIGRTTQGTSPQVATIHFAAR